MTSVIAAAAEEDCVRRVKIVPAKIKIRTEPKPKPVNESRKTNISGLFWMSGTAFFMNSRPIKRIPKPIIASARCLNFSLPKNINGKKIPIMATAMGVICILKPKMETIQAVTVVPILAPMITPVDSINVISPAFTKLTTITVVVVED